MTGTLQKNKEGQWVIDAGKDIPVNSQHGFWLQLFGEVGREMVYVIQEGEALLKASKPDNHIYSQD